MLFLQNLIKKIFFWPHCVACGILVPQPGIKPTLPALEAWSPNHLTTREVLLQSFEATALFFWQPGSLLRRPVSSFPIFCRSLKGLLFVSRFWAPTMVIDRSLVFLCSAGRSMGSLLTWETPSFSSGKPFYIISLILCPFHFLSVLFWCSGWSDVGPYILRFNFLSCLSCFH